MLARVIRRADRYDGLIHQKMVAQLRGRRIIEVDCQIDARALHIDVIVAGQHGKRDRRIAAGKIAERGNQPALGDGRARIDR